MNVAGVDVVLRLAIFVTVLLLLLILENQFRAREVLLRDGLRRLTNVLLFFAGIVVTRLLGPLVALNAALYANSEGLGLLNNVEFPAGFELLLAMVLLDLSIYLQHVVTHKVPFLWRLHAVHHADSAVDVTTALRFHPLEIMLSMVYKVAIVIALGASWWAVLCFEIALNALAMFNHANIRLSQKFDSCLVRFLVTPSMHVIHHSVQTTRQHSNFGFGLSLWDRLFNTYSSRSLDPTPIGLSEKSSISDDGFIAMLRLPFGNKTLDR